MKSALGLANISGLTCVDQDEGMTSYDNTGYTLPSRFIDYVLVYYVMRFSQRNVSTNQTTPYMHHGIIMPNAIKALVYYGEFDHYIYVYNENFTRINFDSDGKFYSVSWSYTGSSSIYVYGYK